MLAVDSSTWIAYYRFDAGHDTEFLTSYAVNHPVHMPPVVHAELLSYPELTADQRLMLAQFPLMGILPGYWERAGLMRADLFKRGLKANLPDALIAQSCIDHDIPLLTRATDFRHFQKHCGLKLFKVK